MKHKQQCYDNVIGKEKYIYILDIGLKEKETRPPWHLNGFSDGSNIGSTVYCRAEAHRYTVCVLSSHSFWTSRSLDVPAGVTQEEGPTGFFIHLPSAVRALIFLARRIQSHSFPSSTVKSNFVY